MNQLLGNNINSLIITEHRITAIDFTLEILATIKYQTAILDGEFSSLKTDKADPASQVRYIEGII